MSFLTIDATTYGMCIALKQMFLRRSRNRVLVEWSTKTRLLLTPWMFEQGESFRANVSTSEFLNERGENGVRGVVSNGNVLTTRRMSEV